MLSRGLGVSVLQADGHHLTRIAQRVGVRSGIEIGGSRIQCSVRVPLGFRLLELRVQHLLVSDVCSSVRALMLLNAGSVGFTGG